MFVRYEGTSNKIWVKRGKFKQKKEGSKKKYKTDDDSTSDGVQIINDKKG